jgi:hypothetical protein
MPTKLVLTAQVQALNSFIWPCNLYGNAQAEASYNTLKLEFLPYSSAFAILEEAGL